MKIDFRLDESDMARFEAMTDKEGPTVREELGPCWLWTGTTSQFGHGQFRVKPIGHGLHQRYAGHGAHRIAWLIAHPGQTIPKGTMVRHRCDNPPCVRPHHLELGTAGDNTRDMYERGRAMVGEKHGQSKLTDQAVMAIREDYAENGTAMAELARRHGVTDMTIRDILTGKSWRHITDGVPVQRAAVVSETEKARRRQAQAARRRYEGEAHHLTPLTAQDVLDMRAAHADHGVSGAELARIYGVSRPAVSNILRGRTWKSVTHGVDVRTR